MAKLSQSKALHIVRNLWLSCLTMSDTSLPRRRIPSPGYGVYRTHSPLTRGKPWKIACAIDPSMCVRMIIILIRAIETLNGFKCVIRYTNAGMNLIACEAFGITYRKAKSFEAP